MHEVHAALLGLSHPHSMAHLRTLQAVSKVASITLWDKDPALLQSTVASQGEKISGTTTDLASVLAQEEILFVVGALRNDLGPPMFTRALEAGKHLITDKADRQDCNRKRGSGGRGPTRAAQTGRLLPEPRAATDPGCPPHCRARADRRACFRSRCACYNAGAGAQSPPLALQPGQGRRRHPLVAGLPLHRPDIEHYADEIVSVAGQIATRSGEDIDGGCSRAVAGIRLGRGGHDARRLYAGHERKRLSQRVRLRHLCRRNGRLGRITYSSNGTPTSIHVESAHPSWAAAPRRTFDYTFGESPAYGGASGEMFLRAFISACEGNGEPLATGEDAIRVAKVVDAAYESSRSGRRIVI